MHKKFYGFTSGLIGFDMNMICREIDQHYKSFLTSAFAIPSSWSGRLSKEEIEKMVADAEKYKEEDDKEKDRISAKNALESYAYNMKSTMEDEKIKDKIAEDDKTKIMDKCKEVLDWLDSNQVSMIFFSMKNSDFIGSPS